MVTTLFGILQIYAIAGVCLAAVFLVWGIGRIDENARGAWAFRPLLIPGLVLIWPLVAWRWIALSRGWDEDRRYRPPRRAQDRIAVAMALSLPVILITALLIRQDGPVERGAVQLVPAPAAAGDRR